MEEDGRNSPPAEEGLVEEEGEEDPLGPEGQKGHLGANVLLVVPKEKPPMNVVGDVHGKIAILVVRGERERERD